MPDLSASKYWARLWRPMDKKKFTDLTEHLLKWNSRTERHYLKPQNKICEDCGALVENRRVYCQAYLLGSKNCYFKHQCTVCDQILFSGKTGQRSVIPVTTGSAPVKHRRLVQTPEGQFATIKEAALKHNVSISTLWNRLRSMPKEYYYIQPNQNETKNSCT